MLVYNVQNGIFDDAGVEHVELTMRLTAAEADDLLASFDPQAAASPPAAECRAIARPVAEAIAALGAP